MHRAAAALLILVALAACRPYRGYDAVSRQGGLVPADQYARYSREHAQAVAIGRSLAAWYAGATTEGRVLQVQRVREYAATLPDVVSVEGDTIGYHLTVRFRSGWVTAVVPINDGKHPAETPNLPAPAAASSP
jgi:hypothetical protein